MGMNHILLISLLLFSSFSNKSWRDASRESVHTAPGAAELKEDIVLIYVAKAFSWRGYFGVHPWIAWKRKNENQYTVAQVTSWNIRSTGSTVSLIKDLPDRRWFDSYPEMIYQKRGENLSPLIEKIEAHIKNYPFKSQYKLWPGPNSNTFISYLLRNVDELDIELPSNAIGKDYFGKSQFFSKTPSSTGLTISFWGYFGLTLGLLEGIELNLLGLHIGLDFWNPAIKLPFIGRVGFKDKGSHENHH